MNKVVKALEWVALIWLLLMLVIAVAIMASASPVVYYKPSADCANIKKETYYAIRVAANLWAGLGFDLVVTSCMDRAPGRVPSSLHPQGYAVDLSFAGISHQLAHALIWALRKELGDHYQVIYETTHAHVEFDPNIPKEFRP